MRVINFCPAVEETLRKELQLYLDESVKITELYPNQIGLNVSLVHPFEYFHAKANGAVSVQENVTNLFPSVTVLSESDNPIEEIAVNETQMSINSDLLAYFKVNNLNPTDERDVIISNETIAEIETLMSGKTEIMCLGYESRKIERISIEVWADNNIVKNRLYTIVDSFLSGSGGYKLSRKYNIDIKVDSITGNRSGNYNFDFGKTLFGGILSFDIQYLKQECIFDETTENMLKTNEIIANVDIEIEKRY